MKHPTGGYEKIAKFKGSRVATFENLSFFRGMSAAYSTGVPNVVVPRRDRRPRHSSNKFHQAADEWFRSKFGIAYRSGGVFVTPMTLSAGAYGASPDHVMRVIPMSEYRYCWSPKVTDLLFAANRFSEATNSAIEGFLNDANYREGDLQSAYDMGVEIMLHCEMYLAIPIGLCRRPVDQTGAAIILPTGCETA